MRILRSVQREDVISLWSHGWSVGKSSLSELSTIPEYLSWQTLQVSCLGFWSRQEQGTYANSYHMVNTSSLQEHFHRWCACPTAAEVQGAWWGQSCLHRHIWHRRCGPNQKWRTTTYPDHHAGKTYSGIGVWFQETRKENNHCVFLRKSVL